ncbi:MAG: membrane protein insertase YidC [Lentisphaeria bacterium]
MDKKSIIGAGLCGVLLVAWFPLMNWMGWSGRPSAAPPQTAATPAKPATPAAAPAGPAAAPLLPAAVPAAPEAPAGAAAPARPLPLRQAGKFDALLDPASGGLTRVSLATYNEDDRKTPVCLGSDTTTPLGVLLPAGDAAAAKAWGPLRLVSATPDRILLERQLPQGLRLRQEWRVSPDRPYLLECRISIANPSAATVAYEPMWFSAGALSLPPGQAASGGLGMPSDLSAEMRLAGNGKLESYTPKNIGKLKPDEAAKLAETPLDWLALHTKYFTFLLTGGDHLPFAGARLGQAETRSDVAQPQLSVNGGARLAGGSLLPGTETTRLLHVYAGPKEYKNLKAMGNGADSLLQMDLFFFFHPGWMGWISQQVLQFMVTLHDHLKSSWAYGLAIIIITLIVKLLFWPLTHYSTMSMKRMQVLQPQITAVREKYKDDPRRQQEKIMEVYRENKVNPMGGCLPMLLQIPVFFALFNVFRGAIELRHSTFLWVTDLAQPDTLPWMPFGLPIRPLAILMAATMFLQQKLTPSAMDPAQAKMMMIMTLFFSFLFYSMPAGLTLYWTVNQALGIVQMLLIHRMITLHPAPVAAKA